MYLQVSIRQWCWAFLALTFIRLDAQEIVGGDVVFDGQYPFMVGLLEADEPNLYEALNCGASLISPRWVLTAAHCVQDLTADDLNILTGTVDLENPTINHSRLKVRKVHIHPQYQRLRFVTPGGTSGSIPEYDIALIELETEYFAPVVTLPQVDDDSYNLHGLPCKVMGWGNEDTRKIKKASRLKEADIFVIERDKCKTYPFYDELVTENMLCAGMLSPGDPIGGASGDSGGPLIVADNNGWKQVGIMSWGRGYTAYEIPGVYQKLSSHLQWIEDKTGLVAQRQVLPDSWVRVHTLDNAFRLVIPPSQGRFFHYGIDGQLIASKKLPGFSEEVIDLPRLKAPSVAFFTGPEGTWSRLLR